MKYMQESNVNIQFFNTLSRKKETFVPYEAKKVSMYTCGPTVYNYAHIGNLRTYVFEDLLRRSLIYFGYQVTQVMNLTDVDDKTIKGAIATKQDLKAYTKPYIKSFFEDLKTLNISPCEHYPAATDYIQQMINLIQGLIDKGFAYKGSDGCVYFSITKFPNYGALSHLKLDDLQAGASERIASDEYDKECVSDFVLWKAYSEERDGQIFWESPFGPGRPGWHIECSCMAMEILGDSIDIHCGGVDNIFPHHENEIAQSECCSGKTFAKYWLHSEHLIVDNKKMSKSLGNFYTLRDLLEKGYAGRQVRYLLLQTHYKTQLNFTLEGLEAAKASLKRMDDFIFRLGKVKQESQASSTITKLIDEQVKKFDAALADDLNISVALSAVFDLIKEVNQLIDDEKVSLNDAKSVLEFLEKVDPVLGIFDFKENSEGIPQELQQALKDRIEARSSKNWGEADRLRDYIHQKGYVIEDSPDGSFLKKVN
ncbi:MAG: cysteine--tRNA ligase [Chlamydiales bacterium]|nr:cysteine--tRNA ligase [Chlamydiales bacterium]